MYHSRVCCYPQTRGIPIQHPKYITLRCAHILHVVCLKLTGVAFLLCFSLTFPLLFCPTHFLLERIHYCIVVSEWVNWIKKCFGRHLRTQMLFSPEPHHRLAPVHSCTAAAALSCTSPPALSCTPPHTQAPGSTPQTPWWSPWPGSRSSHSALEAQQRDEGHLTPGGRLLPGLGRSATKRLLAYGTMEQPSLWLIII